ncbi:MAG: glycoside hydrolase family 127 protein [Cyclobacteriaceae bacterium]|nr:glycoside hydrolase family 127 protein [Cyclobacteriaceae bacterium]
MRNNAVIVFTIFMLATMSCSDKKPHQQNSPFQKLTPIEEKYKPLTIAEFEPQGWLKEQLRENLDGFAGRLDTLVPELIMDDRIYGEDRLTKKVKHKNVGALGEDGDWQVQFLWWNSETQSNWRDGYIRTAILLKDEAHLAKLQDYVNYILSTQDEDGYLGIYDNDLRYNFDNENGELWAKASLLRGLWAWYEYTKDEKVFTAIERAVKNMMENYPVNNSQPFYSKQPNVGGTSHGLTITDVLESLYRVTGNESYREYCLFLYKDFSEQELNESAQYKKLVNDTLMLTSHGVHVYEHLRSLAAAYYASGNPELKIAIDKFLAKINDETTASGAGVGDEWIGGIKADATNRGYEYCSIHELMHSYVELFIKTGNSQYADKVEKIFLNAAQGSRHPEQNCIAYLKSDNSYYMTGGLNGDTSDKHQTRYSYSPVHQEAAVCCVPNAARITPYYIQHTWLKGENTLVASLLGPGTVNTTLNDAPVQVSAITNYPFENTLVFNVTADTEFELKIRKPDWVTTYTVSAEYQDESGFIVLKKKWSGKETVTIDFKPEVIAQRDINNEVYFSYGALVLASPIASVEERVKTFPIPGFYNLHYSPKSLTIYEYMGEPVRLSDPTSLRFKAMLWNTGTKNTEEVELIPMGKTILRQVTFKEYSK